MFSSRASSISLLLARKPQTLSGSASAASTCWPSGVRGHHRLGDTRSVVGQRDRRDVVVPSLDDLCSPSTHPIILVGGRSRRAPSTVDEQCSELRIA
jgi:hypothetical protein